MVIHDFSATTQTPEVANNSIQNGIVAARRRVAPLSFPLFEEIVERLEPGMTEYTHFSTAKELGVSVLSYYRLSGLEWAPPTARVTEIIASTSEPIEARLGSLVLFGKRLSEIDSDDTSTVVGAKLAIELRSYKLKKEARQYTDVYQGLGLELNPYPADGQYRPHLSLAHISAPIGYFKDPQTMVEFKRLANLRQLNHGSSIWLEPIRHSS